MREAGQTMSPEQEGPSVAKVAMIVLVAAVVVLAGTTAAAYSLSRHYYDSKYRAQYHIVLSFLGGMNNANRSIEQMINSTYPDLERFAESEAAHWNLEQARTATLEISVMYPDNSSESKAFMSVHFAVFKIQEVVDRYRSGLQSAFGDHTYERSDEANSLFLNVTQQMSAIASLVHAGIDHSRDALTSPYSLVKRMDLVAIEEASSELDKTCGKLLEPAIWW